jgi:hypothetical protein
MKRSYLALIMIALCQFFVSIAHSEWPDITLNIFPGNPVLQYSGAGWDATRVHIATVLKLDGAYYMYYAGMPFANNYQIGLATSANGINWAKSAFNPVIANNEQPWCAFRVQPRSAMLEEGLFKLWFFGDDTNLYATPKAGFAQSNNGIEWNLSNENPIISKQSCGIGTGIILKEVIKLNSTYYAYYVYDCDQKLYYATSTDGVHFVEGGVINTNGSLLSAATKHTYNGIEFVFSVWENSYYGISLDGVNFDIHPNSMVQEPLIEISSILIEDDLIKFWGGRNVGPIIWPYANYEIWYATAIEPDWKTFFENGPPTFVWPVDFPKLPLNQRYACPDCTGNGKYHSGFDLVSTMGSIYEYKTSIKAVADGKVVSIFRTKDTKNYCDGSEMPSDTSTNNHGHGNAVIIKHENGKFTSYSHLDCIEMGIAPLVNVEQGDKIGIMGNSAYDIKRCNKGEYCTKKPDEAKKGFNPHLHFEMKEWGVLGNLSDHHGQYYGYTPQEPNWHGYINPYPYLEYRINEINPVAIKLEGDLFLRTGPGEDYSDTFGTATIGQRLAAFSEYGGWYQVWLPSEYGPATGWVQGVKEPTADLLRVNDNDPTNQLSLFVRNTPSIEGKDSKISRVWDGQCLVATGRKESGTGCRAEWQEIYLTNGSGWICGDYTDNLVH